MLSDAPSTWAVTKDKQEIRQHFATCQLRRASAMHDLHRKFSASALSNTQFFSGLSEPASAD